MRKIKLLKNTIQNYAWGSPTAIPELLGDGNPKHEPKAELWMGAHPKAPSFVNCDGQWISLIDLIDKSPREILGDTVASTFNNRLPYLFKVLAAAKPLSIQAHPSLDQAKNGYEKENRLGISLDAPNRNYKDKNHKPECICALSSFWALYGFRAPRDIIDMMVKNCPLGLAAELERLRKEPNSKGLKRFFTELMTMESRQRKEVVDEAAQNAIRLKDENPVFLWMTRLANEYPFDIGILSPMLLNLIELKPGEAMFLPAGQLHAYLEGVGIELMANSDNVLRGGLTPKHIDIEELLKVLNFESLAVQIFKAEKKDENERVYECGADEFLLSVVSVSEGESYRSKEARNVEIILCTEGEACIQDQWTEERINIKKGDSAIIPAALPAYTISGKAVIYKAAVP